MEGVQLGETKNWFEGLHAILRERIPAHPFKLSGNR